MYVVNTILNILLQKGIVKIKTSEVIYLPEVGWIIESFDKGKHIGFYDILDQFKKLIKEQLKSTWPDLPPHLIDLIGDIKLVHKMRNNYAHRLTLFDIISIRNHDGILTGIKKVWSDLKEFYNSLNLV